MWLRWLGCYFLLGVLSSLGSAQIVLDGSLGPSGALSGTDVTIPADVGQQRDTNLFHSFREFNVPTGGSAMFTGPDAIENILGRVTGNNPSNIDGRIGSDISNVNLFLFNPNGMLFGPHANLDLDGSFSASTADFLRLSDGAIFSADLSRDSQLSSAPLAAFGFWGPNPASMAIEETTLVVSEGADLSFVGGDMAITRATLRAPSGRMRFVSTAAAGEIPADPMSSATAGPPMAHQGTLDVDLSILEVSGDVGGQVVIESGRFMLDRSLIMSQTQQPDTDGADMGIDIAVTGDMVVSNSIMKATALDSGRPGDIQVRVGNLIMDAGQIGNPITMNFPVPPGGDPPSATAVDNGGRVTVTARESINLTDSLIASLTPGDPDAHDISIATPAMRMQGSFILTSTGSIELTIDGPDLVQGGSGNPGDVEIRAETLDMSEGAVIFSGTFGGTGVGGILEIEADHITVTDSSLISSATTGEGNGGTVIIKAKTLTLDGRSDIESDTSAGGDGGEVLIEAGEVNISQGSEITSDASGGGNGGEVTLRVGVLNMSQFAEIASDVVGTGDGGNVRIVADDIIVNFAQISSETFGSGKAGSITLEARNIRLTNRAEIDSDSERGGSGDAGEITVRTGTLVITGRAEIDSTSRGTGAGGSIALHATEAMFIRDRGQVITNAADQGAAGSIMIETPRLEMNHGRLAASASPFSENRGGNIILRVPQVRLTDSTVTTAARSREGGSDGGDITMQQAVLVIADASEIKADAFGGDGGSIRIDATDGLLLTSSSVVDASSELGLPGLIDFQAPVTIISDSVEPLPQTFVQITKLLQARCESRLQGHRSSTFIVSGREGVPVEPGGMLPSPPSLAQPDTATAGETVPTARRGRHDQKEATTRLARACDWWQRYRNKMRHPAS